MRILFVHQNFPGQFRHLAPRLAARGDEIVALTFGTNAALPGVRTIRTLPTLSTGAGHPWIRDFDTKVIRGEATLQTALALKGSGFSPDLILAHPGWGDTLFLKDVWPDARLAIYCEFFYRAANTDHDFDPEFTAAEDAVALRIRMRLRNLPQRLHFDIADAGMSPTLFQAATYPAPFRERIAVIHDGVDTATVAPGQPRALQLADGRSVLPGDELVTFAVRTLEPYRGFHTMIRALPALLRMRPRAQVVIVGRNGVGYGTSPPAGTSWKSLFLGEVIDRIDHARVHFIDMLAYPQFLNLLRLSTVHVYLTYPFVLSWSMLEAMASGCAIVASDTGPVSEFIEDGVTGRLTSFFNAEKLADEISKLLADVDMRRTLGLAARERVRSTCDLREIVLPYQLAWIDHLLGQPPRSGALPV